MSGIYGGVTNIAPGIMGLCLAKIMVSTTLSIAYAIWVATLGLTMVTAIPMIYDSPFHQIMFERQQQAWKTRRKVSREEHYAIRKVSHEIYNQDLFPSGSVKLTLTESAKRYNYTERAMPF